MKAEYKKKNNTLLAIDHCLAHRSAQLFAYKNSALFSSIYFSRSFCDATGYFPFASPRTNAELSTTNNLLKTNEPFRIKRANIFSLSPFSCL